ncbi:hypothetical protein SEA_THYATIRA_26 [Mycobacterium phage Thyatira]|uniref:Uncharacterized protein n=2 Tax=Kratiovirus TaxID=2948788 RepID=A0A345M954_9CAUD|nr:hypothetical protein PBI_OKIROE_26 [Mycobacterium phage OkiRoe]YP_009282271.1 hypothetical protein SEA_GENGAR_26 [Mycobacterium phage Gengar]YP_009951015.1 hypothetical protein I5G76_gp75 [Mycobacterium phage Thyatira]AHZ95587.1 hypothetical protein PBI_OKIROE_26 [Mycobacterium phage OkiRoe]AON96681.1 hypothetical protein SEA_GENGAR_26 [Mycobacterium phage Gengar]AXH67025.1 hypothetical protein SEA_THYATIRA_26 [Mycobacterium phage Thyatira]
MLEIRKQLVGFAKKIDSLSDACEVLEWARGQDGMAFTVVARADGAVHMQFEGVTVATVHPEFGKWLVFDGIKAEVLSDAEFDREGVAGGVVS